MRTASGQGRASDALQRVGRVGSQAALRRQIAGTVATNKTLSHMSYARQRKPHGSDFPFEAHDHAHGTLKLIRNTWGDFMASVHPEFQRPAHQTDIEYWLREHTENWRIPFRDLWTAFERGALTGGCSAHARDKPGRC